MKINAINTSTLVWFDFHWFGNDSAGTQLGGGKEASPALF